MLKINNAVPIENILSKQFQNWEKRRERSKRITSNRLNITISRVPYSRGGQVAGFIADQLNWHVFDKEIVDYVAGNAHVYRQMIEQFDEKNRHEIDNMLAAFMDSHMIDNSRFEKMLAEALLGIGRHGDAIILGRGANFVLPDSIALKVRITDSIENRLKNFNGDNPNSDIKSLRLLENERRDFIKRHFSEDIDNCANYDLVINMKNMDTQAAGKSILCALVHKFNIGLDQLRAGDE